MKKILVICCALLLLLAGCALKKSFSLKNPSRVLILGNSITWHRPAPQLGWKGDWGMAASSRDKDYVHLIMARVKSMNSQSTVKYANIADFERNFWTYDYKQLDSLRDYQPDIVIFRIGENVDTTTIVNHDFKNHLNQLSEYFKQRNAKVRFFFVSSFWKRPQTDEVMKAVAKEKKGIYFTLSSLSANPENSALGQFENKGVAAHPSDKGMAAIAERIWEEMIIIKK